MLIVLVIIIVLSYLLVFGSLNTARDKSYSGSGISTSAPSYGVGYDSIYREESGVTQSDPEIKEGTARIKSKDAVGDAQRIRGSLTSETAYVETSNKSETNTNLRLSLTLRIPTEEFDAFIQALTQNYDVESYDIRNYRISLENELTEIAIIEKTLNDYEQMRTEIASLPVSSQKIELLFTLNEKELALKQKARQYQSSVTRVGRQSDLATLAVILEEKKKGDLLPEDVMSRFRNSVRSALDTIVEVFISIITGSVTLFFQVVKYIIYTLVVIVPAWFVYGMVRRAHHKFQRHNEKNQDQ